MRDPRSTSPGSIMPVYDWLHEQRVDLGATSKKLEVMRTLGVPYEQQTIDDARALALAQGQTIADDLQRTGGVNIDPDAEIVALIAYLQQLGVLHEPPPLARAGEVK
jgi:cytochrome c oxidase cbb3-type subunit I/II